MPEGMDINALLEQAQQMQNELQAAQAELSNMNFSGSAGGDLVEATVTGTGELVGLRIDHVACDPDDTESLADMIIAAVREANARAQQAAAEMMPDVPM